MKILLDTHAFLWFESEDADLSLFASDLIFDLNNELFLSPASYWEIAIKVAAGKYNLSMPFETFFQEGILRGGMKILPVKVSHAATFSQLPLHHKDPFDRMIIAQAITEQIPVISVDPLFECYPVTRLW